MRRYPSGWYILPLVALGLVGWVWVVPYLVKLWFLGGSV